MLRNGLLSPRSKLFAGAAADLLPDALSRLSSVFSNSTSTSTASVAPTKRGLQKDTARRHVRHHDGALLRGGLALTTGLGWSDSEDEDAPSPLTAYGMPVCHA
jgi:hypothetical protein